uniref:Uncharacterized protein n=1 Tax=Rhodosorus marinus TaxID=101924 RepID=A0A7S2ZGJ8_9RHOD
MMFLPVENESRRDWSGWMQLSDRTEHRVGEFLNKNCFRRFRGPDFGYLSVLRGRCGRRLRGNFQVHTANKFPFLLMMSLSRRLFERSVATKDWWALSFWVGFFVRMGSNLEKISARQPVSDTC